MNAGFGEQHAVGVVADDHQRCALDARLSPGWTMTVALVTLRRSVHRRYIAAASPPNPATGSTRAWMGSSRSRSCDRARRRAFSFSFHRSRQPRRASVAAHGPDHRLLSLSLARFQMSTASNPACCLQRSAIVVPLRGDGAATVRDGLILPEFAGTTRCSMVASSSAERGVSDRSAGRKRGADKIGCEADRPVVWA